MSGGDVAKRIDALAAQARYAEAAAVAAQAGDHTRATELCEQACDFGGASEHAALAGDLRRALVLAALGGQGSRIDRMLHAIAPDPNRSRAAAEELRARGHVGIAARLLEQIGDLKDAAIAYADAGLAVASADAYVRLGLVREAARVLEAAHRADPRDEQVALRLAELLIEHRRFDAATRLLQTIAPSSPLRPKALPQLAKCYEALGLDDPLESIRREAAAAGLSLNGQKREPQAEQDGVAQVVYGRYEIVRPVASTPAARVFEAIDRVTQQRVAIKQLRTEGLVGAGRDAFERLAREARALEQVRHPNVVPLVELIAGGGSIITPWMAGGSLSDLMDRERVTPARAVEIAAAVLGALAEAHRLGILHRDVKPSNILFDAAGVPRLADFGAAHVSDSSATATAGVIGTLAYMSPEQRYGQPATPASDVYSVGATLLEMLTGQPPPIAGQPPRQPSSCHPDLHASHDALTMQLVADDASARGGALEARKRLLSLPWPTVNRGAGPQRAEVEDPEDAAERLQPLEGDVFFDRWLGRRVLRVADGERMREVARAYAAARGSGLCAVLRFDAEASCFWFEVPDGKLHAESAEPLSPSQITALAAALETLHGRGVAHGCVDPSHIVLRAGEPVLLFEPRTVLQATPEGDLAALQRLAR